MQQNPVLRGVFFVFAIVFAIGVGPQNLQQGLIATLPRPLQFAPFVTHTLPLDEISDAFDLMHESESIRAVDE